MKESEFTKVSVKLSQLITEQSTLINEITSNSIIKEWALKDIQDRVRRARRLHSWQDEFFKNELYHLLGMGNLTVSQTSQLLKSSRSLSKGRTIIKQLSTLDLKDLLNPSTNEFRSVNKTRYISKFFNIVLES